MWEKTVEDVMSEKIQETEITEIEVEGNTVEDATKKGLEILSATLDEVDIIVVKEPVKKILFMLGASEAKVKLVLNRETGCVLSITRNILLVLLEKMGLSSEVMCKQEGNIIFLNIYGQHSALLIGKQGRNLDALQHIVGIMVNKAFSKKVMVVLNVGNYREKRREDLVNLALRLAEKAKHTGERIAMKPMAPYDRMIIHRALREDNTVKTLSEGEGFMRKVVIFPKR